MWKPEEVKLPCIQQVKKGETTDLKHVAKIRPFLSLRDAEKLAHAFTVRKIDYCNALLPENILPPLQKPKSKKPLVPNKETLVETFLLVDDPLYGLPTNH